MNARATRRGVPAIALWGGLGALAWATITVLTGGGSAQADEQKDPSLLGEVSSLVTGTVSTVGDTVTAVTEPIVTQVVAPVVHQVVAPVVHEVVAPVPETVPAVVEDVTDTVAEVPVVGDVATPVVETVTDTAQAVVTPVADLLQDAPVSQIVDPVQDAVAALPVVGGLLRDLGVTKLLDDVTGVVDDTTGIVGEVVESTVPPVLVGLDPTESLPPVVFPPVVVPDPGFAGSSCMIYVFGPPSFSLCFLSHFCLISWSRPSQRSYLLPAYSASFWSCSQIIFAFRFPPGFTWQRNCFSIW